MRVLVYPHMLSIGGSQLNAIELAGAIRDRGHEAIVFGVPGPLVEAIGERRLEFIPSPVPGRRPSLGLMRRLAQIAQDRGIDIVHAYEWPPALEAFYGVSLRNGPPTVATVLATTVAPFLPKASMPLIVGTPQIAADTARMFADVHMIERPVDLEFNAPFDPPDRWWARAGLDRRNTHAVIVSRLAELKQEGIERSITATDVLGEAMPSLCLVIVGDGPARGELERQAFDVNARLGREAVVFTGEVLDPRPYYAMADVVLGQGSSILRAMAFAKPAIVLGESGYCAVFDADTAPDFLWQGFSGFGDGDRSPARLVEQLRAVLSDQSHRRELGAFAHNFVRERFSLDQLAARLEQVYEHTLRQRAPVPTRIRDAVSNAGQVVIQMLRRPPPSGGAVDSRNGYGAFAARQPQNP